MKILLDECITKRLKPHLANHEVLTVSDMNWRGLKNGALMSKCIDAGFEIFLTIDKNLLYQQNIGKYNISIVVLDAINSKIETLKDFLPLFEDQIPFFEKKNSYTITK